MILLLAALQAAPAVPPVPPALRQPPATMVVEPVAMAIAGCDANGDGQTTRAEMEAGIRRSFEVIDTARSGKLGYIAFADWAERYLGDRNALPSPFEVDADGDNAITLAELEAQFGRVFDRLDRNKDGVLTRPELLTIRATPSGEHPGGDRRKRGRGRRRGDDQTPGG